MATDIAHSLDYMIYIECKNAKIWLKPPTNICAPVVYHVMTSLVYYCGKTYLKKSRSNGLSCLIGWFLARINYFLDHLFIYLFICIELYRIHVILKQVYRKACANVLKLPMKKPKVTPLCQ